LLALRVGEDDELGVEPLPALAEQVFVGVAIRALDAV
jgi:hypothetical protein